MALIKPSWLETLLGHLNWDILSWHIYVGDTIESAIDWVLGIINTIVEWAAQIGAWWEDFRQEVIDAFNAVVDFITEGITNLGNIIETWWTNLSEWWSTKVTWIKDLIDTAEDWLMELIDDVRAGLDQLGAWWDNFTTVILPGLAEKLDITKAFDDFMLTWKDLFEGWEAFKDSIVDFFSDPFEWLKDRIETWFWGGE